MKPLPGPDTNRPNAPLKVCMIVKNQLWNDARVKKEALSLSAAGYHVTVVSLPEEGKPACETWEGCRILRPPNLSRWVKGLRNAADVIRDDPVKPSVLQKLLTMVRRSKARIALTDIKRHLQHDLRLLKAAWRAKADIYHAHDLDTLAICWTASRLRRARLVYDSHELWLESQKHLFEDGRFQKWSAKVTEKCLARRADLVIAVTEMRAGHMRKLYPGMKAPVIVKNCPNLITGAPTGEYLRLRMGCPPDCMIVLYQGILSSERGLEELIEAASILKGANTGGVAFALMGSDYLHGRLDELIRSLGVGDMVFTFDPVPSEALAEVTVSADAGMILFRNSCLNHCFSLPNKLYEYMMAGIPVIASDLPEMKAVIEGTRCGLLVDPSSPPEIARAVAHLASRPEERRAMGERGLKAAQSEYNWKEQERILLNSYRGIFD
ncbi:MAG: glycosyltransferase family 4 protein [Candidatus Fermentibacteraceae bacterium]